MELGLLLEVGHVHVALGIAVDGHHRHSGHDRGGGVGAVRAVGDQAHRALRVATMLVVGADHHQARILALRAGVRLQAHGREAGDLAEPLLERAEEHRIALPLLGRRERVDLAEAGPRHRDHLAGGVQLHGARTQRDHAVDQAQVLALQAPQVPEHLVLGVVVAEGRLLHERAGARAGAEVGLGRGAHHVGGLRRGLAGAGGEDLEQVLEVGGGDGLVERHADGAVAVGAEVDLLDGSGGDHAVLRRAAAELHAQRVEPRVRAAVVAERLQASGQRVGGAVNAPGDGLQAFRPVPRAVHAGDHGQEHLRGADVAGGALALDVLLARLDRHAQCGLAGRVTADADEATGHLAHVLVLRGEERGVRSAEAHRHAEALRAADHHVCAPLTGRREEAEGERVRRHHEQRAGAVHRGREGLVVMHAAAGAGVLDQCAAVGAVAQLRIRGLADDELDSQARRAGLDHGDGLRMAVLGDEEVLLLLAACGVAEAHGLGSRGAFIEQGGVGHLHAGELRDHGLPVEERLHAALGDLGLVRRVGRVPTRVLQDVAQDHGRRDRVVVAHAQVAAPDLVLVGQALQGGQRLRLAALRELLAVGGVGDVQLAAQADAGRDGGIDELGHRRAADGGEHPLLLLGGQAQVTTRERVERVERTGNVGGGGGGLGGGLHRGHRRMGVMARRARHATARHSQKPQV